MAGRVAAVSADRRSPFSAAVPSGRAGMATRTSSCIFVLPSSLRLPRVAGLSARFQPVAPLTERHLSGRRRSSGSLSHRCPSRVAVVASAQSKVIRVIQTAWRVSKDGIEAGSNLVPASVPRPLARIGVASVAGVVALILLNSFLSTLFFAMAMMGFIYFTFIALNTDEGSRGGRSTSSTDEETLEEARRIMEKYK